MSNKEYSTSFVYFIFETSKSIYTFDFTKIV